MKKGIIWFVAALAIVIVGIFGFSGPHYKNIDGWTAEQNKFVKEFLYESQKIPGRKVAVFDIDGTLIGQVPHYLADEAIFAYAEENQAELTDTQINAVSEMRRAADNSGGEYVKNRIRFLSGMSPEEIAKLGGDVWEKKFAAKVYPEMQALVRNLQKFGWEVYGMTCSPEFLYQDVTQKYFGIPPHRIIGGKGIVKENKMTAEIVEPFPCYEGKAESIQTFIKDAPLIVAGNSGGDSAMVAESVGIKIWVNPNDKLADGCRADEKCIIVYSNDMDNGLDFAAGRAGIKSNKPEPKADR